MVGGCCPSMNMFQSEPMQLVKLIVPIESAHLTVSYLSDIGLLQFKDIKKFGEMARKLWFFKDQILKADLPFSVKFTGLATKNVDDVDVVEVKIVMLCCQGHMLKCDAMKFCKKYQEYMNGQRSQKLPAVGLKQLKKILKRCRKDVRFHGQTSCTSQECPVCDGSFFPSLLKEMSQVVGTFNHRAQKLLALHLESGFRKYFIWIKGKRHRNHAALIQEGKDLVTYALINAIAIRKILKKYDKVHYSKLGQAFKSQAQSMHMEILQSPWLIELMAFHINSRKLKANSTDPPAFFEGAPLVIADDKPTLSCELFDSVKVDVDLTCSICLDTVFDSVALSCGHIFCYMCACSAASVTIVDGLKEASPKEKCPLCREAGVFAEAVHLEELNILLKRNCREYWDQRLQRERAERIKQAKQHWESQCRAFVGV